MHTLAFYVQPMSFYRGLLSPVVGYGTMFAISFSSYGQAGRFLLRWAIVNVLSLWPRIQWTFDVKIITQTFIIFTARVEIIKGNYFRSGVFRVPFLRTRHWSTGSRHPPSPNGSATGTRREFPVGVLFWFRRQEGLRREPASAAPGKDRKTINLLRTGRAFSYSVSEYYTHRTNDDLDLWQIAI